MFQVHTPDDGSIFLSFSVYLDRSHSSFPFFVFFCFFFFFFSFFVLFNFLSLSFPRLFPAAYLCTSPGRKKTDLSASWWPNLLPSTKKANWTRPCANFQEITIESMPFLPLEESWTNTLIAAAASFACLPACLPACLSACLPARLPACLPACPPACLPSCLPIRQIIAYLAFPYASSLTQNIAYFYQKPSAISSAYAFCGSDHYRTPGFTARHLHSFSSWFLFLRRGLFSFRLSLSDLILRRRLFNSLPFALVLVSCLHRRLFSSSIDHLYRILHACKRKTS
jgi:hypothetical protein